MLSVPLTSSQSDYISESSTVTQPVPVYAVPGSDQTKAD